jgi:hypothetical protein
MLLTILASGCGAVVPASDDAGAARRGPPGPAALPDADVPDESPSEAADDGATEPLGRDASVTPEDHPSPKDGASQDSVDSSADAPGPEVATDGGSDQAPADASPRRCTIKINEVQTGGLTGTDEFVELFNTCGDQPVSLAGYKLVYRADAGTSDILRVAFTTEGFAAGHPFFVCANVGYAGVADARFTDGLRAEGGGLALRGPDGRILDSVGWGTASNDFVEGKPAPAPLAGQSIAREPDGADTDDNSRDFVIKGAATSPGAPNGSS